MAKEKKDEQKSEKKGISKKMLIVIGAAALAIVAGVSVPFLMGGSDETPVVTEDDPTLGEQIAGDVQEGTGDGTNGEPGAGDGAQRRPGRGAVTSVTAYVFENPFQVNLIDASYRRFLQLDMQIETHRPEVVELIKENVAPLRDTIILLLSSKRTDELSRVEGKLKLKQEIIQRMEGILEPGSIKSISFTDFKIVTI